VSALHSYLLGIYAHLLGLRDGRAIVFKTVADTCPRCGRRMEGKSSGEREIATLAGGPSTIVEEYFVCPRCADGETGRRVIRHSEPLRGILPPNSKYGYDVEIEAGHLQYADGRQVDEIKGIFEDAYGLTVPQSQIHGLGIRFLEHMAALHWLSAPLLKELFGSGCVYHVDATCEAGRGMELSVREGWTGIVLGAWKIPTENEDDIKRHLRSVVEAFGEPVAFVSDLGNGMMAAIAGVIREMSLKSRQLVCHMHFLKAVGKSILEDACQSLKSQMRKQKTLAHLNRFVKETGDIIKPQAAAMRDFVAKWRESAAQAGIPGYMESVAVLRALAQWVILYGAESSGEGFPFALPPVRLFDRCARAVGSILGLAGRDCFRGRAVKHAARLLRILQAPVADPGIRGAVRDLEAGDAVFAELRGVLRLERADVYRQDKDKKCPDSIEAVARLGEETSRFRGALAERLEAGGASDAQAGAIRAVIDYIAQYEPYLFNHFHVYRDASGDAAVKLIERTNNIMENSYRAQKHQIRRRTGAKNLGFVFEHLFPAASMMPNLENPVYLQTVLDGKARGDLADLFATLDGSMAFRDTPMFQDDFEVVGGRLPRADKKIVGKPGFAEAVHKLADEYCKPSCQGVS
jgi:hypothetical protein